MRKFTLFAAAAIALAFSFCAEAYIYITSCGVAVQTVSPELFENRNEAKEFYAELNAHYCKKDLDKDLQDKPIIVKP